MLKKRLSLKKRGLVPTIQPEPDFSWTCRFCQMLDNVELIMYMKFQKLLMTGCRDMDKNIKNTPKVGFFPICDSRRFFFKNRALSLLYPYGTLTSCKKLEKTNERSLRYLKTDHGRTDQGQGRLLRTPSGKPGVQNSFNM